MSTRPALVRFKRDGITTFLVSAARLDNGAGLDRLWAGVFISLRGQCDFILADGCFCC